MSTPDACPGFAARIDRLRAIDLIRPYRYGLWAVALAEALLDVRGSFDAIEFIDCQAEGFVALRDEAVRDRFADTPMLITAAGTMSLIESLSGFDPARFGRRIYHRWEHEALEAADLILAPSQSMARRIASSTPRAVIPHPVMPSPIACLGRPPLIVFVGSVEPNKGVHTWLQSLTEVLQRHPHVRAAVIGPDTNTSPTGESMTRFLRERVPRAFTDRIHWLGSISRARVQSVLGQASLLIAPSRFESFSYAVAEAVAAGVPVVVSSNVGVAEHLPGTHTIIADDAHALAEAQDRILTDLPAAQRTALQLRDHLATSCSGDKHLSLKRHAVETMVHESEVHESEPALTNARARMRAFLAEVEACEQWSSVHRGVGTSTVAC